LTKRRRRRRRRRRKRLSCKRKHTFRRRTVRTFRRYGLSESG